MDQEKNLKEKVRFTMTDGSYYEGEFENGCPNGEGKMTLSNGEEYEGQWKDGKMHGDGSYYFKDKETNEFNGKKYEGQFAYSQINGYGKMIYDSFGQIIYCGNWKNGKRDGFGQLYLLSPSHEEIERLYSGTWKNDQFVEGVCIEKNGDRYSGEFSDYCLNGNGTVFLKDGSWQQGRWENNELQDGYMYFANGTMQIVSNNEIISEQQWKIEK